jgi:hypothetical protein
LKRRATLPPPLKSDRIPTSPMDEESPVDVTASPAEGETTNTETAAGAQTAPPVNFLDNTITQQPASECAPPKLSDDHDQNDPVEGERERRKGRLL